MSLETKALQVEVALRECKPGYGPAAGWDDAADVVKAQREEIAKSEASSHLAALTKVAAQRDGLRAAIASASAADLNPATWEEASTKEDAAQLGFAAAFIAIHARAALALPQEPTL